MWARPAEAHARRRAAARACSASRTSRTHGTVFLSVSIGLAGGDTAPDVHRRCCATPTWPCATPSSAARTGSSATTRRYDRAAAPPHHARARAARRDRARRAAPGLPAGGGAAVGAPGRRRGAAALAPPGAGQRPAGRVHPARRGVRADRPGSAPGCCTRPATSCPAGWPTGTTSGSRSTSRPRELHAADYVAPGRRGAARAPGAAAAAGAGGDRARRRHRHGRADPPARARCARPACGSRWTTSAPATPRWASCAGCRSTSSRSTTRWSPSRSRRDRRRPGAPMVDVVVRLGHRLGLEVIAEGMTNPARAGRGGRGRAAGSARAQLFGWGVPAEHLEALLDSATSPGARPTSAVRRGPRRPASRAARCHAAGRGCGSSGPAACRSARRRTTRRPPLTKM